VTIGDRPADLRAHVFAEERDGWLRVEPGDGPLRAEYDRICRRLLERGDASPEITPGTVLVGNYSAEAQAIARANWLARMRQEHDSAAVFAGMLPQLVEAGCSLEMKTVVLRSAIDELRHAALCGQVATMLGGEPVVEANLHPRELPRHEGCSPLERIVRNVLFVSCISETVAVAVLTDERDHVREPNVDRVLQQLAGDETLHARIGWIFVRENWPKLDNDARERMHDYLAAALGYYERRVAEVATPHRLEPALVDEARALGFAYGAEVREIVRETLETVVVPQLAACGPDARRAWASRVCADDQLKAAETAYGF
jgi:hypothetical protein